MIRLLFFLPLLMLIAPALVQSEQAGLSQKSSIKITISNIEERSIQASWQAQPNATRYELSFGTDTQATNRGRSFVIEPTMPLTKLQSNTIYSIKVRAIVAGRALQWSSIKTFSTKIPLLNDFKTSQIADTGILLTWSNRYSDLPDITFELSYGTDLDASSLGVLKTTKNSLTVKTLQPESNYYFKIRATNPLTAGPWSKSIIVKTMAPIAELAPSFHHITPHSNGTVRLNWTTVSTLKEYELHYSNLTTEKTILVKATSHLLHVKPDEPYTFKVRWFIKDTAVGPWSGKKEVLTLPGAPTNVVVSAQTPQETILGWDRFTNRSELNYPYQVTWGNDYSGSNMGSTTTAHATFSIENLGPDKHYKARIRQINITGSGPWSKPVSFKTFPAGLKNLSISNIKHSSATLSWPNVNQAIAYEISFGSDSEANHRQLTDIKKSPALLEKLIPNLTYYVKIRPLMRSNQYGAWSQTIPFTTFSIPEKPEKPEVTLITGSYATVSWTAMNTISSYDLLLSEGRETVDGKQLKFKTAGGKLEHLDSNTLYSFKYRAVNSGGFGEWSDQVSFTTPPDKIVKNLKIVSRASTEAALSWDPHPGPATLSYLLRYSTDQENWSSSKPLQAPSYNLASLTASTSYYIQVQALNSSGKSPWTKTLIFKTPLAKPETAPEQLTVTGTTDVSATFAWEKIDNAARYQFSIGTDIDASNQGIIDLNQTHYQMKGLVPNTSYFVKTRAINTSGEGPWSDGTLFITKISPPITAPTHMDAFEVYDTSITIMWQETRMAQSYQVSIGTDPIGENLGDPKPINQPPYKFENLHPDTNYFLKVRNVNQGGSGPWSRILKIRTPNDD